MFHVSVKKFDTPIGQKGFGSDERYRKLLDDLVDEGFEDTLMILEMFSATKMALLGLWSFDVTWCGKSWKTKITDLSQIATSISIAAYRLQGGRAACLDFFEQWIHQEVHFKPISNGRVITTLKGPFEYDIKPPQVSESRYFPRSAEQDKDALVENLRQAFKVYYEAVRDYCPEAWSADLVKRYFNSRFVKFCIGG